MILNCIANDWMTSPLSFFLDFSLDAANLVVVAATPVTVVVIITVGRASLVRPNGHGGQLSGGNPDAP